MRNNSKSVRHFSKARSVRHFLWCLILAWLLTVRALPSAAAPHVERPPGQPLIVFLAGDAYELGHQHGQLLREDVRASVAQTLRYFRRRPGLPIVGPWFVNRWLDRAYARMEPFIPLGYREEMRGLADGSGVSLREIHRLHAIPDVTGTACSSLAVFGRATVDGRLYHTRNLDWNIGAGIQAHAALFVVRPRHGAPFVNIGYAGFVGVLSGINAHGISVGEIGADTVDETLAGEPMPFVLREVLETSLDLEMAARRVAQARRTRGYNYLFADGMRRAAIALETTHGACVLFHPDDPRERQCAYGLPQADVLVRADTAIDPGVRVRQRASRGRPGHRPPASPVGSGAYEKRYKNQALRIREHYGRLDAAAVRAIVQAAAPSSNVQSVIYGYPEVWVANAEGITPAAQSAYHRYSVEELFGPPAP